MERLRLGRHLGPRLDRGALCSVSLLGRVPLRQRRPWVMTTLGEKSITKIPNYSLSIFVIDFVAKFLTPTVVKCHACVIARVFYVWFGSVAFVIALFVSFQKLQLYIVNWFRQVWNKRWFIFVLFSSSALPVNIGTIREVGGAKPPQKHVDIPIAPQNLENVHWQNVLTMTKINKYEKVFVNSEYWILNRYLNGNMINFIRYSGDNYLPTWV